MSDVIGTLNALAPIVAFLVTSGLVVKYVPLKVLGYIDNSLIPLLGALVTFLGPLDGLGVAPAAAHAGIFGDILGTVGNQLSTAGKVVLATGVMAVASGIYELFGRTAMKLVGAKKYDPNAPPVDKPEPPITMEAA